MTRIRMAVIGKPSVIAGSRMCFSASQKASGRPRSKVSIRRKWVIGSISLSKPMRPDTGSSCRCTANSINSRMPNQKPGSETPNSEHTVASRSKMVFFLTAAMTPTTSLGGCVSDLSSTRLFLSSELSAASAFWMAGSAAARSAEKAVSTSEAGVHSPPVVLPSSSVASAEKLPLWQLPLDRTNLPNPVGLPPPSHRTGPSTDAK